MSAGRVRRALAAEVAIAVLTTLLAFVILLAMSARDPAADRDRDQDRTPPPPRTSRAG